MRESDMLESKIHVPAGIHTGAGWVAQVSDQDDGCDRQEDLCALGALRRLAGLVVAGIGQRAAVANRHCAEECERRICLAAQVHQATFGSMPIDGSLERRLHLLAESLAELLADPDQVVRVKVTCSGACPTAPLQVILHVAHILVSDAIKHGFILRLLGHIRVDLHSSSHEVTLVVADDGWCLRGRPGDDEALRLVRALIAPLGGTLGIEAGDGVSTTVVLTVVLPIPGVFDAWSGFLSRTLERCLAEGKARNARGFA